jgi:carbon-monoxide dehydrogenase medium subunit
MSGIPDERPCGRVLPMYPFTYRRAGDLAEALSGLRADAQARLLAGGMTLLPSMKHRLSAPSALIDIARLPALRGIARDRDALAVGAAMRHAEVAHDATVRAAIPALADLASAIGDPQVRARGTIGGSVANNDPAADYPAAVLGCRAVVVTDRRGIPADDFFQGMFTTALEPDEIIVAVRFDCPQRAAYAKFAHPASGYAMTGVFVAQFDDEVRVAVTGAGPGVFRWREAEVALRARPEPAALDGMELPADGLNADLHAPAAYRAHLVALMTRRAVAGLTGPNA